MAAAKKRKKSKKTGAKRIAAIKKKIEAQRRRAARPTLPVNTQARVSETLVERKRKAERRRVQRAEWEDL